MLLFRAVGLRLPWPLAAESDPLAACDGPPRPQAVGSAGLRARWQRTWDLLCGPPPRLVGAAPASGQEAGGPLPGVRGGLSAAAAMLGKHPELLGGAVFHEARQVLWLKER